jgi:crotonobetainyl-CoA:carnitine CoA-transferase CaiB-like acyl-CoA transferase
MSEDFLVSDILLIEDHDAIATVILNRPEKMNALNGALWARVGAANQANWARLLQVLQAEELGRDPRFVDNAGRINNLPELVEALAVYFRQRTTAEWLEQLDASGVPAGPVLSIADMHADQQTQARQMVVNVKHSRLGPVKTMGLPVKFSVTPGAVRRGAPLLGEHTREVLAEYGYSADDIDRLIDVGAVFAAP